METISERDFTREETIYITNTVEVFKARMNQTGRTVAVKKLKVNSIDELNSIQKESYAMVSLHHKNIVELMACFVGGTGGTLEYAYFIMDYYPNGDLSNEINKRIRENCPWTENELLYHIKSLIDVYCWLQRQGLAHRDIKPGNIFVNNDGDLLVANLRCAYSRKKLTLEFSEFTIAGTPLYLSPKLREAFMNYRNGLGSSAAQHDPIKSDVYSLGLTFLYMASLKDLTDLMDLRNHEFKLRERIQEINYSNRVKEIITNMLIFDEERRPDFVWLSNSLNSVSVSKPQINNAQNQIISPVKATSRNIAAKINSIQKQTTNSTKLKARHAWDWNNLLKNKNIKVWVKRSQIKNYLLQVWNSVLTQPPLYLSDFINLAKSARADIKVAALSYKCIYCNSNFCDSQLSCSHHWAFHKECVKSYIYPIDNGNIRYYLLNCWECNQRTVLHTENLPTTYKLIDLYAPSSKSSTASMYSTNQNATQYQAADEASKKSEEIQVINGVCRNCKHEKRVIYYPKCRHRICNDCAISCKRKDDNQCFLCPMTYAIGSNKQILEYLSGFNN